MKLKDLSEKETLRFYGDIKRWKAKEYKTNSEIVELCFKNYGLIYKDWSILYLYKKAVDATDYQEQIVTDNAIMKKWSELTESESKILFTESEFAAERLYKIAEGYSEQDLKNWCKHIKIVESV